MPRKRPRLNVNDDRYEQAAAEGKEQIKTSLIVVFSIIVNLFLFFNVSFVTLIPTTFLIVLFVLSPFIGYFILKLKKITKPTLYAFAFAPLTLNVLFLFNYLFSFDPVKETYGIGRNSEAVYSKIQRKTITQTTTGITLENNAYEKYYGIRVFLSEDNIRGGHITYTFKTGILGMRVMTDYEF
jgi:hypothetical protein